MDNPINTTFIISHEELLVILKESVFNWFEVVRRVTEWKSEFHEGVLFSKLEPYYFEVMDGKSFSDKEKTLLEQAHQT